MPSSQTLFAVAFGFLNSAGCTNNVLFAGATLSKTHDICKTIWLSKALAAELRQL